MRKLLYLSLFGFLIYLSGCANHQPTVRQQATDFFAMNTYITITAYGDKAETATEAAKARICQLDSLLSVTDPNSEIYALNHKNSGTPLAVSQDTERITAFALDMAAQTNGALEPTIYPVLTAWGFTTDTYQIPSRQEIEKLLPRVDYTKVQIQNHCITLAEDMQLDLGAVAKGYAGDEAAACLRSFGITSAILNLGGNVQTIGYKPDGSFWQIGLQAPGAEGHIGILQIADCAVVTSGGYQKYFLGEDGQTYHHIIDPATGRPAASGIASATVISRSGRLCDALSTALFVMGVDKAVQYWQQNGGFEMILLTDDNKIYLTAGLVDSFTLEDFYADWPIEVVYP